MPMADDEDVTTPGCREALSRLSALTLNSADACSSTPGIATPSAAPVSKGQAASPAVCAVLYTIHPSLAIGSMFLAVATVPIAFFLCGQAFFVDPVAKEAEEAPNAS